MLEISISMAQSELHQTMALKCSLSMPKPGVQFQSDVDGFFFSVYLGMFSVVLSFNGLAGPFFPF